MSAVGKLKKAVPPRARIMIVVTVAIVGVFTFGILNLVGDSDAPKREMRGDVRLNLNPTEEQIGRSQPGDAPILPEGSAISQVIEQEQEREAERALNTRGVSLTETIRVPTMPRDGVSASEAPSESSNGTSADASVVDNNRVRQLIEERRESERKAREAERANTPTPPTAARNGRAATAAFDPNAFMKAELDGLARSNESIRARMDKVVANEALERRQGSAQLSRNGRQSGAGASGSTPSGASLGTSGSRLAASANVSDEAAEYLDGFVRERAPAQQPQTVADRLAMYRQAMQASQGNPGGQLDQGAVASLLGAGASGASGQVGQSAGGAFNGGDASVSTTSNARNGTGRLKPAGSILYAVLDTAVNSDNTTHIRATIVQEGPFKGAHLLGQISLNTDRVVLQFNRMGHKGADHSISAVAVDPDTAQTVLADKVDYHRLERYGLFWGAAFLEGFADALSNTATVVNSDGSTTTTRERLPDTDDQILVATGKVGERSVPLLANRFNRKPTVYLSAGRPIGVMLLQGLPY